MFLLATKLTTNAAIGSLEGSVSLGILLPGNVLKGDKLIQNENADLLNER